MINLEYERRKANYSQRELSRETGVGQNYISFAEARSFVPAEGTQRKLASFLNWKRDPRELFDEKED